MAVYRVVYKDESGNTLKEVTLPAEDISEILETVATVPSARPPAGTHETNVQRLPDEVPPP